MKSVVFAVGAIAEGTWRGLFVYLARYGGRRADESPRRGDAHGSDCRDWPQR